MPENSQLSERELEILRLVATGASNKDIAGELVISVNTVKVHLRNIYAKLEVSSRTEATIWAVRSGIVVTPGQISIVEETPADGSSLPDAEIKRKPPWWIGGIIIIVIMLITLLGIGWFQIINANRDFTSVNFAEVEEDRWQAQPEMPVLRANFAIAEVGDIIYLIGGEIEDGLTASVLSYATETGEWQVVASLPEALADIQATAIGGRVFVPGGRSDDGSLSDQLLVYDPLENKWSQLSSLPIRLSAYALVPFEGRLYLFGGWDGTKYVNRVFEYNPLLNLWDEKKPLPTARGFLGAAVAGDRIHVLGGSNGEKSLDVHEVYSPGHDNNGGNPWSTLAPLPEARSRFGVVSIADILHLTGGQREPDGQLAFKYIPTRNEWESFNLPFDGEWTDLGVVSLGTLFQVMGGRVDDKLIRDHFSYQAIYTVSIPILP